MQIIKSLERYGHRINHVINKYPKFLIRTPRIPYYYPIHNSTRVLHPRSFSTPINFQKKENNLSEYQSIKVNLFLKTLKEYSNTHTQANVNQENISKLFEEISKTYKSKDYLNIQYFRLYVNKIIEEQMNYIENMEYKGKGRFLVACLNIGELFRLDQNILSNLREVAIQNIGVMNLLDLILLFTYFQSRQAITKYIYSVILDQFLVLIREINIDKHDQLGIEGYAQSLARFLALANKTNQNTLLLFKEISNELVKRGYQEFKFRTLSSFYYSFSTLEEIFDTEKNSDCTRYDIIFDLFNNTIIKNKYTVSYFNEGPNDISLVNCYNCLKGLQVYYNYKYEKHIDQITKNDTQIFQILIEKSIFFLKHTKFTYITTLTNFLHVISRFHIQTDNMNSIYERLLKELVELLRISPINKQLNPMTIAFQLLYAVKYISHLLNMEISLIYTLTSEYLFINFEGLSTTQKMQFLFEFATRMIHIPLSDKRIQIVIEYFLNIDLNKLEDQDFYNMGLILTTKKVFEEIICVNSEGVECYNRYLRVLETGTASDGRITKEIHYHNVQKIIQRHNKHKVIIPQIYPLSAQFKELINQKIANV